MALLRAPALMALALILTSCGSSTSTNTSPSSITRCAVNVQGGGPVPAEGGTTTITVNAARECSWSAETEGAWLSIKAGATGQGEGSVVVAAAPNPDPVTRRGAVVLNERRHEVVQEAGECSITLADRDGTFPQSGGNGRVEVRASSPLCTWTAESSDDWIVLRSAGTGKGSGEVPFEVRPTNGPTRTGFITVAGQRFEITQTEGCAFDLEPSSQTVGAEGGSGTVAIRTAADCPWTAESQVSWLSLSAGEGAGPATVSFSVQPTTVARTGTALIGGRTFTVTQSAPASPSPAPAPSPAPSPGPSPAPSPAPSPEPSPEPSCSYNVEPRSHSADAKGGDFSVSVTTAPACSWSASSNVSWITVSRGGASTGRGSARFTVSPNNGAARSGTVTVAGATVTVTQSQGCSFAISPESASVGADGGSGRVTVKGDKGCDWTASSNASWIRLTGGESGSGNGEVSYVAEANSGNARVGTITIAGLTFTLNQERESRCRYRVRPDDVDVPARGRLVIVAVETSLDCQWRAISEDDWINVVLNIAGFGDGLVTLSVSPNDGKKRKGTVRIGGEKVTISQEGDDD